MTREEVISKIRKLFELSNSPNENEAALAAAKARELLSKHNLSMADLPTDKMDQAFTVIQASAQAGKVLRHWVKGLLIHVARGFDCEHLIQRSHGTNPLLTFIGTAADAEAALYTFEFLHRKLHQFVELALPQLRRENRGWPAASLRYAYLEGAVVRIGEKFEERARQIKDAERKVSTALIVVKERAIKDYMAERFADIYVEKSKKRTVSAGAFEKGYRDGDRLDLRPGMRERDGEKRLVNR
jgi:hypothetical protein